MIGRAQTPKFGSTSHGPVTHGPVRGFDLPKIALRRRSQEHPMAMFAVAVSACFITMAAIPATGPAFAALDGAPLKLAEKSRIVRTADTASVDTRATIKTGATTKADRLPVSDTQRACQGQSWGNESLDCLLMIAKDAGKDRARSIRMIAAAEPNSATPNVF
jgi:hypothetical protein